jgi:hypothetical protein
MENDCYSVHISWYKDGSNFVAFNYTTPDASIVTESFASPAGDKLDKEFINHIRGMKVGDALQLSTDGFKSARAVKVAANRHAKKAGRTFEFAERDEGKTVIARVSVVDPNFANPVVTTNGSDGASATEETTEATAGRRGR